MGINQVSLKIFILLSELIRAARLTETVRVFLWGRGSTAKRFREIMSEDLGSFAIIEWVEVDAETLSSFKSSILNGPVRATQPITNAAIPVLVICSSFRAEIEPILTTQGLQPLIDYVFFETNSEIELIKLSRKRISSKGYLDYVNEEANDENLSGANDSTFANEEAIPSLHNTRSNLRLIAFYLPQFHPIPVNDKAWGKNFTDWDNVTKTHPLFDGHYQPHLPLHSGFYDLRIVENQVNQARLAQKSGLDAFCYYFYWFNGETPLELPLQTHRNNQDISLDFFLCWANEPWTKRWDGLDSEIIIPQNHSLLDTRNFAEHVCKHYFTSHKYSTIEGRPILAIYRPSLMGDVKAHIAEIRMVALKHGFEPFICCVLSFHETSETATLNGFDSSIDFPPHRIADCSYNAKLENLNHDFHGKLHDYAKLVVDKVQERLPTKTFPGVMLGWDNTARRGNGANVFVNFSTSLYSQWLENACFKALRDSSFDFADRLVFVNAWNEWAEGTHLEPDRRCGYTYLSETAKVFRKTDLRWTKMSLAPKNEFAIYTHVYYEDVFHQIKDSFFNLLGLHSAVDLIFTCSTPEQAELISESFPESYIKIVENRGRDVLPFIQISPNFRSYNAVLKLHTKKSFYRKDGSEIMKYLVDTLLNPELFIHCSSLLNRRANLGLIYPKESLVVAKEKHMVSNRIGVQSVLKSFGFNYEGSLRVKDFVAGTMFWFKPNALVRDLMKIPDELFSLETGEIDGATEHAVERLIKAIIEKNGYESMAAEDIFN